MAMGVCYFDGPTIINGFKTEMTLIKQLNIVDRKKLSELHIFVSNSFL